MFRRAISVLAILLTSSVTMANESLDLVALLQTTTQSENSGERYDAVQQLQKRPPSSRIVKAFVAVLIDPASDLEIRQAVSVGIGEQLKRNHDLYAPHELVAALDSPALDRALVIPTLGMFRKFELQSLPTLQEKLRTDDELFVWLAGTFFVEKRLISLSDHPDDEIRSLALGRLWRGTQDAELCLPLYLRESQKTLAKEIQDQVASVDAKINELRKKQENLPADDPARETIEIEVFRLGFAPSKRKKCAFAFRQFGKSLLIHEICENHPIASGEVLSRMIANKSEPEKLREQSARLLGSIAESYEADRKALVDAGVITRLRAALAERSNDEALQAAITTCITALETEHDRTRAVKLPKLPDNPIWQLPSRSELFLSQNDGDDDRLPQFNNPLFPRDGDASIWTLPEGEPATIDRPTSWDGRIDSSLARHAPSLGYITNAKEFATLWTKWNGDSPTPKIDFDKYIVLAAASQSSSLQLIPELSSKGDLTVKTIATADLTSDHRYVITLVAAQGVKAVNGRPIPTKSTTKTELR